MSSDTYISFYLQKPRIHVHSKTLIDIGNPRYVRFLVKEDGSSMVMESYHKKDFHSHRVPKRTNKKWEMEISSLALCTLLKNKLNWESGKSYRVPGKIYPSQHLAVFDLSSAAPINQQ